MTDRKILTAADVDTETDPRFEAKTQAKRVEFITLEGRPAVWSSSALSRETLALLAALPTTGRPN